MAVDWLQEVRSRLAGWRELGLDPSWVVAVSGGSDSVGLLRLLHGLGPELGLRLSVAHLDHGVRGEAARVDAEFVAELAEALGLPFDLGHWKPARPGHFEADARRARSAWLVEVARARGASAVALGHTRDDQAETILHRILRGTGPRGLAGIPARRPLADGVTVLRPLLNVSRGELRGYLEGIGQPYRDDATNADLTRTRARIRHDLLPKLAGEYNPKIAEALVRLGELTASSHRVLLRQAAETARAATITASRDGVIFNRAKLAEVPRLVRAEVIRLAWRRVGWPEAGMDTKRWRRIAALVRRDRGVFSVGAGIDAWLSAETFRLAPAIAAGEVMTTPQPMPLAVPGAAVWGDMARIVATLDPSDSRDETLDRDRLTGPLWVRATRPSDRFAPLGMAGRSMPLNDFFRGRRIPREERTRVPLVCDDEGIVWVAGHRIAERVRLTETTARSVGLRCEMLQAEEPGQGRGSAQVRGCD